MVVTTLMYFCTLKQNSYIMMKKNLLLLALVLVASLPVMGQLTDYSIFKKQFNVFIANDLGRNGYYDQKPIAELMGRMAEAGADPEFVLATGDVHHFNGVQSTQDPLWMTNYELIYSHHAFMINWSPRLRHHEHRRHTPPLPPPPRAPRRWGLPARYYTKRFEHKGMTLRILWIDTTPLISKYREDSEQYPDACLQDDEKQLAWIDSVLTASTEQWVIVCGHHPIYADTSKEIAEREDMQRRLDPILRKHRIDMYICGHIHNFQHLRLQGSEIDYVVNSAGALSRKVQPVEGTLFCSPEPGFSILSASKEQLVLRMIDKQGNVLYEVKRSKR